MSSNARIDDAGCCLANGGCGLAPEAAAAEPQQQHREILALRAKLAVALDDLHLAAVHQAGSARCHARSADSLRHLGAAFDGREDLSVEPIDLKAKIVDVLQWFCFDRHGLLRILLSCRFFWFADHSFSGLTQETSPGSGSGPRGSEVQLHHGYRRGVPVEKSAM